MITINPDLLLTLADKLRRLPGPSHKSPELWHESKSELASELRSLARASQVPVQTPRPRPATTAPAKRLLPIQRRAAAISAPAPKVRSSDTEAAKRQRRHRARARRGYRVYQVLALDRDLETLIDRAVISPQDALVKHKVAALFGSMIRAEVKKIATRDSAGQKSVLEYRINGKAPDVREDEINPDRR
jgi:hypothetical protein